MAAENQQSEVSAFNLYYKALERIIIQKTNIKKKNSLFSFESTVSQLASAVLQPNCSKKCNVVVNY